MVQYISLFVVFDTSVLDVNFNLFTSFTDLSGDVGHILDRLAEPIRTPLSTVVSRAKRKVMKTKLSDSPIPEQLLNKALEVNI